jgi:hypothetical protein
MSRLKSIGASAPRAGVTAAPRAATPSVTAAMAVPVGRRNGLPGKLGAVRNGEGMMDRPGAIEPVPEALPEILRAAPSQALCSRYSRPT